MTAVPATEPAVCTRCERVHTGCRGHNRQGGPCGSQPVPGAAVCHYHGGAAPQVKRKAALRLAALVDPAIATLGREMARAEKSADRQRAANSILDRAGISRTPDLDAATARAVLVEKLLALRNAPVAEVLPAEDEEPVDAELIEEEEHENG